MIGGLGIAQRHVVQRVLRQGRFHAHYRLGGRLRVGRLVAGQLEYFLHVLEILRAGFQEAGLRLQVVVAIWQTKTGGVDLNDHVVGVAVVR